MCFVNKNVSLKLIAIFFLSQVCFVRCCSLYRGVVSIVCCIWVCKESDFVIVYVFSVMISNI